MIMTPSPSVAGRTVVEDLGLVRGNTIRARHVGRDLMAAHDYTKMMAEAREQSLDRMVDQARELGADAVVNVRFGTSYVMGGAAEILVYGSAVKLGS